MPRGTLAVSVAQVGREIELRRHTDADEDILTAEGVGAALEIGARLRGGYHLAVSTGASARVRRSPASSPGPASKCRAASWSSRACGRRSRTVGARPTRRPEAAPLAALREADAELVAQDSERLGAALRRVVEALPDGSRALVVGHSPTNEAAVLGLTGEIVTPLEKGAGVLVVAREDGYQVEHLA